MGNSSGGCSKLVTYYEKFAKLEVFDLIVGTRIIAAETGLFTGLVTNCYTCKWGRFY